MRRLHLAFLIATLGATQVQAGVFDDEEARRQIVDQRIKTEARFDKQAKALEQLNLSLLDLASQIQRQADETARLRGQIETLNYELDTTKKRQQDFYLDLDSRMRKFETAAAGASAAVESANTAKEGQEYEEALNLFKTSKYKESATSFAAFVAKYPESTLAANAQYWLGNAWYAQRNCNKAIEAQSVVTTKYAGSTKAPDAWLAIATCQQELGNPTGTKRSLETVIAKYPNTPAAETAQQRLKKK